MPYGKYRKGTARKSRFTRRTRVPKAVRFKSTKKSVIRRNFKTNLRQSRQIRSLWNRQFGPLQRSLQTAVSQTGIAQPITVSSTSPVCFDAGDFTSFRTDTLGNNNFGCRIWRVNVTGNNLDQAGWWTTANFENNPYWSWCNRDIVDGGRYKPVSAHYTISWTAAGSPDNPPPYVYLHLFTQKAGIGIRNNVLPPGQSIENLTMPFGLVHLQNLANGTQNRMSTSFFKVYKVKRIACLRNVGASDETIGSTKTYYMKFSIHPKRERNQLKTAPEVPGTIQPETGQTQYGDYGAYNVDPRTPFWALLSSSDRAGDTDNFTNVRIMRSLKWRDVQGSSRVL